MQPKKTWKGAKMTTMKKNDDDEDDEPKSKRLKTKENDMAFNEAKLRFEATQKLSVVQKEVQEMMRQAVNSRGVVKCSDLAHDAISIVFAVEHEVCPQKVTFLDLVTGICEDATLRDQNAEGIKKVHVQAEKGKVFLEFEGVNLKSLHSIPEECAEHSRISTNDFLSVLNVYGVEAARTSIIKEVKGVFSHYGINVNDRHLSLIADYMSQGGGLRAFSRLGMTNSTSPLQQMSFETTMEFLTKACQDNISDTVMSPAGSLVVGAAPLVGTGMVDLLMDLDPPKLKWKEKRDFTW